MNSAAHPRRLRFLLHCSIIFAAAFAFRWRLAAEFAAIPFFNFPIVDSLAYLQWSREIAAGDWLGNQPFYQAPLYPYFLAIMQLVSGEKLGAIRGVQGLMGSAGAVFMVIGTAAFFNRRAGLIAGWLMAAFPVAAFFDTLIQKSVLDDFLFPLLFMWLGLYCRGGRRWHLALAGLTAGLLTLSRENALLLLPALVIWIFWRQRASAGQIWRGAGVLHVLVFAAAFAVPLVPVAIRNAALGAPGAITTWQMGSNFYIGNSDLATGTYTPIVPFRASTEFEQADARAVAEAKAGHALRPMEISRFWMAETFGDIMDNPARWVKLLLRKTGLTFNNTEVVDTDDIYFYEQFSVELQMLNVVLSFGVVLMLALFGMVAVKQNYRDTSALLITAVMMLAGLVGFYVVARYRHAFTLPLIPFAAVALADGRWIIYERPKRAAVGAAVALIGLGVSQLPLVNVDRQLGASYKNAAGAAVSLGRLGDARQYYERSLKADPDDVSAILNYANLLVKTGDAGAAKLAFERAVHAGAAADKIEQGLGDLALAQGKPDEALLHYKAAEASGAPQPGISNNQAAALIAGKRYDEARAILNKVLEEFPDYGNARRNLDLINSK